MGRPRKEIKRDHALKIGLTAPEFIAVKTRAERHGMSNVDYGRWLILDGGKSNALPVPPQNRIDRLVLLQLQRLGNLLNQLVRHAHVHGETPLAELADLLTEIRNILKEGLP